VDFLKALFKARRPTFNMLLVALFFTPAAASFYLGIQPHVVSTGSMKPNINPGDVILTKLSKAVELRKGDVILLFDNRSQRSEAHRVLEVAIKDGESLITTKGDSNPLPDPMLSEPGNKPLQKVVVVLSNAGYVLELTHSSEAKLLGGAAILSVISLRGIKHLRSKRNSSKKPLLHQTK
jgi:signal peptidase I